MAIDTSIGTIIDASDPLGEIIWSKNAMVQVQYETFFAQNGMTEVAPTEYSAFKPMPRVPIYIFNELGRGAGSQIRIPLRRQLTRTPRTSPYTYGTTVLRGNEELMSFYDCTITLSLLKNASGYDTPDLYDHVSSLDLEEEVRSGLLDWLIEVTEESLLDAFYEKYPYFAQASGLLTTQTAVAHPNQLFAGGVSSQAEMTSSGVLTAQEMMRLRTYARRLKITPVKKENLVGYCFLADSFALADLRQDSIFRELKDAVERGSDNPVVSGKIAIFQGMHIFEYERIRVASSGANANNVARCALLGSGAIGVVYGSRPRIVPAKDTLYDDRVGWCIRQVFGASRMDFMSDDDSATLNQSSAQLNVWRAEEYFN